MRPVDVARKLCPKAKQSYLAALDAGDAHFIKYGVTTRARMVEFLAQIFHESGALSIEWESGDYRAERLVDVFGEHHSAHVTPTEAKELAHHPAAIFERVYGLGNPHKAHELGNTQPGDGYKFRGGGLMQTTGRANYRRMGQKMGVDLEARPDLLLSPEYALLPALLEWNEGHLNEYADRGDTLAISRAINLGNPHSTSYPNNYNDRVAWKKRISAVLTTLELRGAPADSTAPVVVPMKPPAPKPAPTAPVSPPTAPVPAPVIVPEPEAKAGNGAKHAGAATVVVIGTGVAQQAHARGASKEALIGIGASFVLLAVLVWAVIHAAHKVQE